MIEFTVPGTASGDRLDRFVANAGGAAWSRARVQALIREGRVLLNRRPVAKASEAVRMADVIAVDEPPVARPASAPVAEDIPLSILYEDGDLLVLNKSAGIVVHPAAGNSSHTLVNALLNHCPDSLSGIGGEARPGIVHRLDKDTSGCLVVAKNDFAHRALSAQFADRTTEKRYLAIVCGQPSEKSGSIDAPIGRHAADRKKMAVIARGGRGRAARTEWQVRETVVIPGSNQPASLIECRIFSGRTHQIRVHLKHMGYPILGDRLYAGPRAASLAPRQLLHAWKLGFRHPVTGAAMKLAAPPPPDFLTLFSSVATSP